MDGFKVGSARIYQLFTASSGESSNKDSNTSTSTNATASNTNPALQNTDAVKVSPNVQQEASNRASQLEELKKKVQSGEYQKQMKSPEFQAKVAKSLVEFYSA